MQNSTYYILLKPLFQYPVYSKIVSTQRSTRIISACMWKPKKSEKWKLSITDFPYFITILLKNEFIYIIFIQTIQQKFFTNQKRITPKESTL